MRTEREVLAAVLAVASGDDRIRAVAMSGSRTNPTVPKDIFQDYDIVYVVTDLEPFLRDHTWVDIFGPRIIMQLPEAMSMIPPTLDGAFSYLMQFTDGVRIDLTLVAASDRERHFREDDGLTVVLLDKDGRLPALPSPTDEAYWVRRPSSEFFADCCSEFWWVSTYVAKGLWRREILYAHEHLHLHVRPMLIRMLEWRVGVDTGFSVSVGKCAKYLDRFLPAETWRDLLATYPRAEYADTWRALVAAGDLFRRTAAGVAERLGYTYPGGDDERVTAFLRRVAALPRDAARID